MNRTLSYSILACALTLGACGKDDPTSPPDPQPTPDPLCPFEVTCAPVAGFSGIYSCAANPSGSFTFFVNGAGKALEFGQLGIASSGDIVNGCRPCGCSGTTVLR